MHYTVFVEVEGRARAAAFLTDESMAREFCATSIKVGCDDATYEQWAGPVPSRDDTTCWDRVPAANTNGAVHNPVHYIVWLRGEALFFYDSAACAEDVASKCGGSVTCEEGPVPSRDELEGRAPASTLRLLVSNPTPVLEQRATHRAALRLVAGGRP